VADGAHRIVLLGEEGPCVGRVGPDIGQRDHAIHGDEEGQLVGRITRGLHVHVVEIPRGKRTTRGSHHALLPDPNLLHWLVVERRPQAHGGAPVTRRRIEQRRRGSSAVPGQQVGGDIRKVCLLNAYAAVGPDDLDLRAHHIGRSRPRDRCFWRR